MAVVLGTNAGFVTEAPVADPDGDRRTIDANREATKDTSPAGAGKITEIGWWSQQISEESNFEIGLYAHDAGNDKPATRLYVDATNAKGTSAGWKTVAVDWNIDPETIYWLAVAVIDTATTTFIDYVASGRFSTDGGGTLPNPWAGDSSEGAATDAIYAVWGSGVEYSELSGTVAAVSTVEDANLVTSTASELSGTIAAVSGIESASLGSTTVEMSVETAFIKRLVVAGNNQLFYEAI